MKSKNTDNGFDRLMTLTLTPNRLILLERLSRSRSEKGEAVVGAEKRAAIVLAGASKVTMNRERTHARISPEGRSTLKWFKEKRDSMPAVVAARPKRALRGS